MTSKVVAIDGTSYVGKSTIAKCLAALTGYAYVNTGHMFRSVAKMCLDQRIILENVEDVLRRAEGMEFAFRKEGDRYLTLVNGENWTDRLDDYEVVLAASKVATIGKLRDILLEKQRQYARKETIVMEGRDIGTVVFPDAAWKFFVTASAEVRAKRMLKLMPAEQKAKVADFRELISKVQALDDSDMKRSVAPLRVAPDAIVYDNSDSPSEMQDALILQYYMTHGPEIIKNTKVLREKA